MQRQKAQDLHETVRQKEVIIIIQHLLCAINLINYSEAQKDRIRLSYKER